MMESLENLKIYITAIFTAIFTYGMYRKKVNDEYKQTTDNRITKVELEQGKYGVTILSIHEQLVDLKKDLKDDINEIKVLLKRRK